MKFLVAVIAFLVFASSAFAESGILSCDKGECEGWAATYEGSGNSFLYHFENVSGKSAFNIKILVNTFDYMGDFLGRFEIKAEGPIHKYINYKARVHPKTAKMTYDIYWSDRSGKTAESTIQGE